MQADFDKFELWLKENYLEGYKDLNPPATPDELTKLEGVLGFSLPAGLRECLSIHNGQRNMAGGLFDGVEFLSSSRIADEWKIWKRLLDKGDFEGIASEPARGIKNSWWNERWIPITYNGAGDHYCIDADPTENGIEGQVITMWHDSSERELVASGLEEWFSRYVSNLLKGRYVYSEDYGSIVPIEDV